MICGTALFGQKSANACKRLHAMLRTWEMSQQRWWWLFLSIHRCFRAFSCLSTERLSNWIICGSLGFQNLRSPQCQWEHLHVLPLGPETRRPDSGPPAVYEPPETAHAVQGVCVFFFRGSSCYQIFKGVSCPQRGHP